MNHLLLFVLMAVCFTAAQAADRIATNRLDTLTLEQALALAERQHPDLAEARALVEAAEGRAQQAGKLPKPEASARMESAPIQGRTSGEAEYVAGVSQSVPLGNRLSKAREAEQLNRERQARGLEVKWREIRKRVHSAFATTLYQEKAFATQAGLVQNAEKAVGTTKARADAGDAIPENVARVEMELARAKVELHRTTSLREQAMIGLTAAIGDPALSVKSLAGTLDSTFEIPTLESLAASLSSHPATAAADAEVRMQNARVDLAKSQRIPDVKVELLYRRLPSEQRDAFDVGVSIPLPLFDRNQGRIREARAELQAAEARSRSTQNELSARLRESHSQLTTALANSRALKTEILPRADTVLKSAEDRYVAGDIGLTEVLPVRRDWAAVQLTYLESLRDVMQAWAALKPFVRRDEPLTK